MSGGHQVVRRAGTDGLEHPPRGPRISGVRALPRNRHTGNVCTRFPGRPLLCTSCAGYSPQRATARDRLRRRPRFGMTAARSRCDTPHSGPEGRSALLVCLWPIEIPRASWAGRLSVVLPGLGGEPVVVAVSGKMASPAGFLTFLLSFASCPFKPKTQVTPVSKSARFGVDLGPLLGRRCGRSRVILGSGRVRLKHQGQLAS